ncbi:MAG: flagellar basal body rod protein FlgB [Alphaproteobacteria bacterium]|nr:flagellar basal body rod protein FlgB [Alphaproteobacteria bacterium]
MQLGKLTLFKLMGARMEYLSERQKLLSENIANADTPYYRPSDLKPMDFQSILRGDQRIKMAVTSQAHLPGVPAQTTFRAEKAAFGKSFETAPNGNQVVLEEQMMKVADLQASYQLATNLYTKNVGMLRMAIGRGGQ